MAASMLKRFLFFIATFGLILSQQIFAATIQIRISDNNDDAEERTNNGSMYITSTDLELTHDGNSKQIVGMRFRNIPIPQGSTISNAYIEFTTDEKDSKKTNVIIYGEDTDNSNAIGSNNFNLSGRKPTSATQNWSNIPKWNKVGQTHQTPDISSIIQEIVTRPGWTSGNNMMLLIKSGSNCSSKKCQRTAESHNGSPAKAPLLVITYQDSGGSTGSCTGNPVLEGIYAGGNIKIENQVTNNGVNITQANTSNAVLGVSESTLTGNQSYTLPGISPSTLPTNSDNTKLEPSDNQTVSISFDTYYKEIKVKKERFVSLTGSADYHITKLTVEKEATLNLAAGNYYIDEFKVEKESIINITSGPVKFYIGDKVELKEQVQVNGGGITDFQILMLNGSDKLIIEKESNFTGMVYAPYGAKIEIKEKSNINAHLVTSGEIKIDKEVNFSYSTSDQTAVATVNGCTTADPTPNLYLAMDEASWNGTSNEVVDSSGNANHGTSVNGANTSSSSPAIATNPGTCGYGTFDGANDYISNSSVYNALRGTASLSFWIKTTQTGNNTVWKAPGITGVEQSGGTNDIFWGWLDSSGRLGITAKSDSTFVKTSSAINNGNWQHIVLTRNANTGLLQIYHNGALVDSGTMSAGIIGSSFSRIGSIEDTGGSPTYFNGELDEVKIFTSVLTATQVQTEYNASHECSSSPIANFTITPNTTAASTCLSNEITITAVDSSGATKEDYDGTINITTSSSHGNWSVSSATNSLSPNPDSNDDGAVSYTFSTSDKGVIKLNLDNTHADTLTINTVDSVTSSTSSDSTSITFSKNAYLIEVADTTINSSLKETPIIGRNHAMKVSMITDDTANSGSCGVAKNYTGNKNVKAWVTRHADDTLGGATPFFNGSASNMPSSEPNSTESLTFSSGVATFNVLGNDVGKFSINLKDSTRTFANNEDITGSYGPLTFRPFGLAITNIVSAAGKANPESNSAPNFASLPDSNLFTTAGGFFSATVSAALWSAADDSDNNGLIDSGAEFRNNSLAASYAWDTTLARSSTSYTPSTGSVGDLYQNNSVFSGTIAKANFTSGSNTVSQLQYTQVGSFTLNASASNFLNSGISLNSDNIIVGRFNPDHFVISNVSNGALDEANTTFTYIGQDFSYLTAPSFRITAYNGLSTPTVTSNYFGSYANLTSNSWSTNSAVENTQFGADGSTKMALSYSAGTASITDNNNGTFDYNFGSDTFNFTKDSNSLVGNFTSDIILNINSITDEEITTSLSQDFNPTGVDIRFGRINLSNAHGSELISLDVPMFTEYYDGIAFVLNGDDSSSSFTVTDFIISQNFASGISSTATINNSPLSSGDAGLSFCPPGSTPCVAVSGNTGYIDIDLKIGSIPNYLQFDWDSDGTHNNAPKTVRVTFGIFNGNPKQIYIRELY